MLFSFFISPTFATEINNPATCDSGTLSTDTGPTNLRANYESNTLNLKWYDDDNNRINVSSSSDSCTYGGTINLPTPPTKKGYTFKGWKVITYTPIEYIQSTGTQYIDTGVIQNLTDSIIFEVDIIPFSTGSYMGGNGYTQIPLNVLTINQRSFVKVAWVPYTETITVDGVVRKTDYRTSSDFEGLHIYLFALATGGTIFGGAFGKFAAQIYSVRIYKNSVLIRDMIPVKDSDGVACMYDNVSKQYFYNAGTGDFIAGPDL